MKNFIYILLLFALLLNSCKTEKGDIVPIRIYVDHPMTKNADQLLPDSLSYFVEAFKGDSNQIFFPEVTICRLDLDSCSEIVIPMSFTNSVRKSTGIYDDRDKLNDYAENIKTIVSPRILSQPGKKSTFTRPDKWELNQFELCTESDGSQKFSTVQELRNAIVKQIVNNELNDAELSIYMIAPTIKKQEKAEPEQTPEIVKPKTPPVKDVPKQSADARKGPYDINILYTDYSNKVSWNRIPGADKIIVGIREDNENPKAYVKYQTYNGLATVADFSPKKGSFATFLYTIEITAYDSDGKSILLKDNKKTGRRISCE